MVIDTGSNRVMLNDVKLFSNYRPARDKIKGINGMPTETKGVGTLKFSLVSDDGKVDHVARTIARKIGYRQQLLSKDAWVFLSDFYRQQREFLESRHLFGETRENKFHGEAETDQVPRKSG